MENGKVLQNWRGYWITASEFIPGVTADQVELTPKLVGDVGRMVASLQRAMISFRLETPWENITFVEKGASVLQSLNLAVAQRGMQIDVSKIMSGWERDVESFNNFWC